MIDSLKWYEMLQYGWWYIFSPDRIEIFDYIRDLGGSYAYAFYCAKHKINDPT